MIKGWEISGVRVPLERVGQDLFVEGWPVSVLFEALSELEELKGRDWTVLRASELGRCLRQRTLKRQKEYWLSPDSVWAALVGRGVHLELARLIEGRFGPGEVLSEMRLRHPFPVEGEELTVTGQVDFYHVPSGTMVDYKTTGSVWNKEASWEYQVQQNVYAQLLRWSGHQPQASYLWFVEPRVVSGRVRHKLVEVELWPEAEATSLLEELGRVVVLAHRDGVLPPAFQEGDEGYWQCRFCPVAELCRRLEKEGR